MKRQMIMLRNLNCPSCAAKLEAAAKKLPGVKAASVAFGSGALNLEFDETQFVDEQFRSVVRQLGLEVATVVSRPGN